MPDIAGRFVPDDHAAATGPVAEDVADEPKRATRKRAGTKAETAMVDLEADK